MLAVLSRALAGTKSLLERIAWAPPLVARVSVGFVFLGSGWGKLHNLPRVIEFFRTLGIPHPELQAPFVAGTELTCGTLLVVGLATRLAAPPLAATMVVAIATALWSELEGVIDLFGRIEFLILVVLFWLVIAGPGKVSVDEWIERSWRRGSHPS